MYDGCLWFLSKYFVCETEKNYNAPQLAVTASSPKVYYFSWKKKSVSFFLCENPQPTLLLLFYVVMKKDEEIAL